MANTSAAKKAMRSSARRAVRNRSSRSAVKTRVTRFRRATTTEAAEQITELALTAISGLDRAASKGILHGNNAARRKSRLQKRLNAALAGTFTVEPAKGTRGKATAEKAAAEKAAKPAKGAKPAKSTKAAAPAKKPAAKKSSKSSS
jgi:small subunit ribosomal protein S20